MQPNPNGYGAGAGGGGANPGFPPANQMMMQQPARPMNQAQPMANNFVQNQPQPQPNNLAQSEAPPSNDPMLLGNKVYPFQCDCGKGLYREREIQQHSSCQNFTTKYCNLLQAFVTLKHDSCQSTMNMRNYQAKMNLYTLLTSFRADIKEHLNREGEVLMPQPGGAQPAMGQQQSMGQQQDQMMGQPPQHMMQQMPKPQQMAPQMGQNQLGGGIHMGAAAASMNDEEEKKEDPFVNDSTPRCVYCLAEFSNQEQSSGQVQMFLADGCYHQFHVECFRTYAKKQLLTKLPSGEFAECRCKKCSTLVQADDLREALGPEWLKGIQDQQTKMMFADSGDIVQCPSCNEVFTFETSQPNYAARDESGKQVSRETAEHMAKYRVRCAACAKNFCTNCKKEPYHISMSCEQAENHRVALKCRYCWEPLKQESISNEPAFMDVCRLPECIEKMKGSCNKTHPCGHKCLGFRGEKRCLPCLDPECIKTHNQQFVDFQLYEDYSATDYCGICMVSGLGDEASIILGCKHIFHVECIKKRVFGRWPSPRITWDFLNCSACKTQIDIQPDHVQLHTELQSLLAMKKKVYEMSIERAKYEGIDKDPRLRNPDDNYYNDIQAWALFKLAYYPCYKCKVPYFGGMKDCIAAQAASQEFKPEELVCAKCSSQQLGLGAANCKTHGTDFIEFKCKFCCSISQWFCWGNTHFCEPCHKKQCNGDYVSRKKVSELPKCPGLPNCPVKVAHPPNGTEFSLGCAICRNSADNVKNF